MQRARDDGIGIGGGRRRGPRHLRTAVTPSADDAKDDDPTDPVSELLSVAEAIGYDTTIVVTSLRRLMPRYGRRGACVRILDAMVARAPIEETE